MDYWAKHISRHSLICQMNFHRTDISHVNKSFNLIRKAAFGILFCFRCVFLVYIFLEKVQFQFCCEKTKWFSSFILIDKMVPTKTCTDTFKFDEQPFFNQLRKTLPDHISSSNSTLNLIECKDDMLFAWDAKSYCVLAWNWRAAQSKVDVKFQVSFDSDFASRPNDERRRAKSEQSAHKKDELKKI